MSGGRIVFDHVWKKFRRGERHDSLRDLLPALARRAVGRAKKHAPDDLETEEFWALRDISFEVGPGQALGIVGPNGAGKSTILKLLTRILRPTRGACAVHGRAGALIEIAAGFHQDLTGRENIFLQGAIMGMRRAEIARKLDEIVDFAGLEAFMDTPVKRYSSGMNARLGFAIAAHLDPDVLIIDEVLSVGDMAFQQRCVDRMKKFKAEGASIAFVSHNLQAVAELCDRALFLRRDVRAIGPTPEVLEAYVRFASQEPDQRADAEVQVIDATLVDADGAPVSLIAPGRPLVLRVRYRVQRDIENVELSFVISRSTDRFTAYAAHTFPADLGLAGLTAGEELVVEYAFCAHLARGQYHIECYVWHSSERRAIASLAPAAAFTIQEMRTYAGIADVELVPTLVERRAPEPLLEAAQPRA